MKILSVVVPTYNMEKYLKQCLDSFIDERVLGDIEILVVNDGSKDKSAEVAEGYVKKYPKTFKLINKENGGHGSTINKGIEIATGKYFKVVDADDWVDTENFVGLVEKLRDLDVDLVLNAFDEVHMEGDVVFNVNTVNDKYFVMHKFTVKTSVLREAGVRLFEHCFYVDVQFCCFAYLNCKSEISFDDVVYKYRLGRSGQSVSKERTLQLLEQRFRVFLSVFEYLKTHFDKSKVGLCLHYVVGFYGWVIINWETKEQLRMLKAFDKKIKKEYRELYKLLRFSWRVKLIIKMHFHGTKFLRMFKR